MSSLPPSLDVTESLYTRMVEQAPEEWRDQFADPLAWDNSMREQVAALLIPAARDEAIAQSQARGDRGFILYDQKAIETYIYYVGSEFADTVLWMADLRRKWSYGRCWSATILRLRPRSRSPVLTVCR
ncbi:MAG: hypothetical protein HC795_04090 [Coleofasciculaceae cyanobacterium RL_1_1]|nr:hypothetical protein [Coleofasciculaceae cyanobacterium RL_1_1]